MKNIKHIALASTLLAATTSMTSAALVASFEFNSDGDFENFSATATTGAAVSGGLLTGVASGNDPQLINSASTIEVTAGYAWDRVEFRVREVRGAPHGGGEATTADDIDFNNTGIVVGGNGATISNAAFSGTALDGSGFTVVTGTLTGNTAFGTLRLDPIGGAFLNSNSETNGNTYEVDYIRFYDTAPVPEPSSTALLGLGGLALILRRRK